MEPFASLSSEQKEVVIYCLHGGYTVAGFGYGGPTSTGFDIKRRTRKSALELIRRTGKVLGIDKHFGDSVLDDIRTMAVKALLKE